MKAVVIGGSGATGKCLVEELLANSAVSEVTALLRKKVFPDHPGLRQVIVDFDRLEEYRQEITGDVAFSCLGTTLKAAGSKDAQWKIDYDYQLKFAELAKENAVPVFGLVSATNANPHSSIFYSRMKGKLEESIVRLGFEKTMIFQPSVLIRPDSDRTGEKIAAFIMKGISRLGIIRNHRPTHVRDLAKAMIAGVDHIQDTVKQVKVKEIHQLAEQYRK